MGITISLLFLWRNRKEMPYKDKEKQREYTKKQYHSKKTNPEWLNNHREKQREYRKANSELCKKRIQNCNLKKKYGISLEEYNTLFEQQNYCCAICNRQEEEGRGKRNVDHCHKTGKIRGILCQQCNTALGKVGDSEEILYKMILYLRKHKETKH